jgi:hypothetical protein
LEEKRDTSWQELVQTWSGFWVEVLFELMITSFVVLYPTENGDRILDVGEEWTNSDYFMLYYDYAICMFLGGGLLYFMYWVIFKLAQVNRLYVEEVKE